MRGGWSQGVLRPLDTQVLLGVTKELRMESGAHKLGLGLGLVGGGRRGAPGWSQGRVPGFTVAILAVLAGSTERPSMGD